MAGQLNNLTTVNLNGNLSIAADDTADLALFGDTGEANADVTFRGDPVGQVVTVILQIVASSNATVGTVTGQLFTFVVDPAVGPTVIGPTFVLPSKLDGARAAYLLPVTLAPGQIVGGLGIRGTDVGGDAATELSIVGATVITSD